MVGLSGTGVLKRQFKANKPGILALEHAHFYLSLYRQMKLNKSIK